jgi:hypothetical protein
LAPDSLPDVLAVALAVSAQLEHVGVRYVIGGSFASSLHGEPRSTNDVDVVADLTTASATALVASLSPDYYVDATAALEAVVTGGSFNVVHVATGVKVDLFVASHDPLDQERLRRRQRVAIGGPDLTEGLYVDTPENTILRKLEWYRRGGETSERQWRDVVAVLRIQRDRLDDRYLRDWAAQLGVTDLLERAERDALGE